MNSTVLLWTFWLLVGIISSLGLLAIVSPSRFARFANGGAKWIDTNRIVAKLDEPIHIDGFVLRFSRLFGFTVLATVVLLAYLVQTHFLG